MAKRTVIVKYQPRESSDFPWRIYDENGKWLRGVQAIDHAPHRSEKTMLDRKGWEEYKAYVENEVELI